MRVKIVPPVRDVAFLREVAEALPRVPDSVEDCCSRIRDRTDLPARDVAREFLTFCEALGLAAETDGAYYRPRETPTDDELAKAFEERVFGAQEVLATLDDGEGRSADGEIRSVEAVFDAMEPLVPRWERERDPDWRATWRERTERLCGWAVAFDLAIRVDDGYRRR